MLAKPESKAPTLSAAFWKGAWLSNPLAHTVLILLVLAACVARGFIGLVGTRWYSHDAFAILDPAWRVLNGQIPHADFFSNLGPAAYFPTVAGLLLAHGQVQGFGYGQALCGLLLSVWAYLLCRSRLTDTGTVLFCLAVVCLSVAPFALGDPPERITPAMTYNRYAYVLSALVLLESLFAPLTSGTKRDFFGGFSTGAALVILVFLKISFAGGALLLFLALTICRPQSRHRWIGLVSGFVVALLPFTLLLRGNPAPMIKDLVSLAGAKHIKRADYWISGIALNAGLLYLYVLLVGACLLFDRRTAAARNVLLAGTATCFVGLLFIFTNYERTGFPLQAFLPILLFEILNRSLTFRSGYVRAAHLLLLIWTVTLVALLLIPSVNSLSYGVNQKLDIQDRLEGLQSPALKGFLPTEEDNFYRLFVDDGLLLVKRYQLPGDTIMTLDFTNPFSYGLGMKPARGGAIALQYGTTFNDTHRPTPEWLFGNASLVMVPKRFSDGTLTNSIRRLYGQYLDQHFQMIGESEQWQLYRQGTG